MAMRLREFFGVMLLTVGAAHAHADSRPGGERVAGTVVAVQGELLLVELGDEPGVGQGTVLTAWRRTPSLRGDAAYRARGVWFEVAQLTVVEVADGIAVTRSSGPPRAEVPLSLDESGADPSLVQIGDRVRTSGAVAARPTEVRVTFARSDLFGEVDATLPESGRTALRHWLRGLRAMEGPITVEVHARMQELGGEAPDLARSMSADEDAPFGPSGGEPVVPVEGLRDALTLPSRPPSGDEILLVDAVRPDGTVDAWRYLDPVTLALRRGEQVAAALAAHLGVAPAAVQVRVVPRGIASSYPEAPGYDGPGDQIRILASGIDWSEPPAERPVQPKMKPSPPPKDTPERRRLLERPPPAVSSLSPQTRDER